MGDQPIIARTKIGILFNYSPKWMGGVVYIINIIKTLNFLDDRNKPEIYLFYREDLEKFIGEINYPYLKPIKWKYPSVSSSYLLSWLKRKNLFVSEILEHYDLDVIYPLQDYPVRTRSRTKLVSWYADLQHKYYPDFFTKRKIYERNFRIILMLKNAGDLVVSSQSVADDFNKFYKLKKNVKLHIYHFVSVIDDYEAIDAAKLKEKYMLPDSYFMISNQFHKHKNHQVLFKALAHLKQNNKVIHLAFTGKFPSAIDSPYLKELHSLINDNSLNEHISFLGVIPRNEQLELMRYSQAVIQPSLFEGWSTVIEDARSLQVPVIASDIPVNIEQLGSAGVYFSSGDYKKLAEILEDFPVRNLTGSYYEEYQTRLKNAAGNLLSILVN